MKIPQSKVSTPEQAIEAQAVGKRLARLRLARDRANTTRAPEKPERRRTL